MVPAAAVAKHHRLAGLTQQKFSSSQLQRPEVQVQVIRRALLPRPRAPGRTVTAWSSLWWLQASLAWMALQSLPATAQGHLASVCALCSLLPQVCSLFLQGHTGHVGSIGLGSLTEHDFILPHLQRPSFQVAGPGG